MMKLLQYTKTLKELEMLIDNDNLLSSRTNSEESKVPAELRGAEETIPMEEMAKLDKFRILRELEDDPESSVKQVEELCERTALVKQKFSNKVISFLRGKNESEVLDIASFLKSIKMEMLVFDSYLEKLDQRLKSKITHLESSLDTQALTSAQAFSNLLTLLI